MNEEEINLLAATTTFSREDIIRVRNKLADKKQLTRIIADADFLNISGEQLIGFLQRTNEYLNNG